MNEIVVNDLMNKYNFKHKIFNNQIFIESKFDTWVLELKGHCMFLRHKNSRRNRTGKLANHLHKKFEHTNVCEALKSIKNHDVYSIKYKNNKQHRIMKLFKKIEKERKLNDTIS